MSPGAVALALLGALAYAVPGPLPAQAGAATFGTVAAGIATKPSGISRTCGATFHLDIGRSISGHAAFRVDADLHRFQVRPDQFLTPPCLPPCTGQAPPPSGIIGTLSAMASVQWYERADRQGLFAVIGLGPQWLVSHPTQGPSACLAAQVGAGLSLRLGRAALLVEARYQRATNTAGELRAFLPVTAGVRIATRRS